MASVDDMVAGNGRNSGAGNAVAAKAGKKVGKTVLKIFLTVFAPIIIVLFFALVIILIIAYWINQIAGTVDAIAAALNQYAYETFSNDVEKCRAMRIKDADNIWDLCAADVKAAIEHAYADVDMGSGFYSKDSLCTLLGIAAEYETDECLTGVYYNSSYTRTFNIDELFFIYLDAYETLCVEGKMPGGKADSIYLSASEIASSSDYSGWDWIYEEYDSDLYEALCELDTIVSKYEDGLIVETYSPVTNSGISESSSSSTKTYSLDLSYLVYPYTYSCGYSPHYVNTSSGNHSASFEQSAYGGSSSSADKWYDSDVLSEMSLFVGEMEEWFSEYGELVNYDPVLEYIWYESDTFENLDADEFYSMAMYDTTTGAEGCTGVDFYDTYMTDYKIDSIYMAALWYARGYFNDDNYWELESDSSLASDILSGWIGTGNNPSGYHGTLSENIEDILDYGYNGYTSGETFYAYFQLHIYGGDLVSFGDMQNAEKLESYGEEGETATLYTVYSATNDNVNDEDISTLWESNRATMIQEVSVSIANDYVNLSVYDVEREYGVTWKLLLAICMAHDLEIGATIGDTILLDETFCRQAAEAIFAPSEEYAENYSYIEGNSIEANENIIIDLMTESGEGNTTLEQRQNNPVSAENVKAMTHYNTDSSAVYCIGEGYYMKSGSVPTYGLAYYSSLLADIVAVTDDESNPTKIVGWEIAYHADELYDAIVELGFEDGLDDTFLLQAIYALSATGVFGGDYDIGILDEVNRYAEIDSLEYELNTETGEYEPMSDCLSHTIYLADESQLVIGSTSEAVSGGSTATFSGDGMYYPTTYFYNLAGTVVSGDTTLLDVISEYGWDAYSETTWFTADEAEQMAEESGYSVSTLFYSVNSTGVRKYNSSGINRYRELTEDEIELIMEQTGLTLDGDTDATGSMYSVVLTALHAVGNIEYQNDARSLTGKLTWGSSNTLLKTQYQTYGYFNSDTYPYAGSNNNLYGFSADCSSFIAWLFHIAGNGIYNYTITTNTYITYAQNNKVNNLLDATGTLATTYSITGISLVGIYKDTSPSLDSLQVGDIIVSTANDYNGHVMLYIGPVDNGSGTTFTAVHCNGEQDASGWGLRGNVYYDTQNFDINSQNYYIFRIDIPDNNRYITQ